MPWRDVVWLLLAGVCGVAGLWGVVWLVAAACRGVVAVLPGVVAVLGLAGLCACTGRAES